MTDLSVMPSGLPAPAPIAAIRGSWERQRRRVTMILFAAPLAAMALLFVVPLVVLLWLSFFGNGSPSGLCQLSAARLWRLDAVHLELAFIVT